MILRFSEDTWYPTEHTGYCEATKLAVDQLVIWDHCAHRVVEIREREFTDWPERFTEKWIEHGMPDAAAWAYRPVVVVVRPDDQPTAKPQHLLGPANHGWRTLSEHYAICRLCGDIPPCRQVHNEKIAERAAEKFEGEMAILPGCCHACREPITRRQKSVRFTGPNLIRPDLGDDSAIFHLRAKCYSSVRRYDERWAKATGNPRRFFCEGTMTVHQGGSTECTELATCPGDVDHRGRIWHRPESAVRMHATGCWCLAGVIA